jgi:hypothetical protein
MGFSAKAKTDSSFCLCINAIEKTYVASQLIMSASAIHLFSVVPFLFIKVESDTQLMSDKVHGPERLCPPWPVFLLLVHQKYSKGESFLRIGNSSPSPRFSHVGERGKRGEGLELTSQMVFGLVFLHSFAGL